MWSVADVNSTIAPVLLDTGKAFHCVSFRYDRMHLLYTQQKAAVCTNGLVSHYFTLACGSSKDRHYRRFYSVQPQKPWPQTVVCSDFPGIQTMGIAHKLMLYTGNILLFISEPQNSVTRLLEIINLFLKFSGYKVNWSKSPFNGLLPNIYFST